MTPMNACVHLLTSAGTVTSRPIAMRSTAPSTSAARSAGAGTPNSPNASASSQAPTRTARYRTPRRPTVRRTSPGAGSRTGASGAVGGAALSTVTLPM